MADFRKWFMVLAVVLVAVASASAQSQITTIPCVTSAQPPIIRAGAITDYIGEVDLSCDATLISATATPTVTVQFVVETNATVTNAILGTDNSVPPAPVTMAGAAVEYTQQPQTVVDTVQGRIYSTGTLTQNALRFPHVVLPMGTTFTVRFFDIRVAPLANTVTISGEQQVLAYVTANTENPSGYSVGFSNETVSGIPVAFVEPALLFAVTNCTGAAASPIIYQQCIDYHLSSSTFPGGDPSVVNGVTFTELQQTAFKNIVEEDGATIGPGTLILPGGGTIPTPSPSVIPWNTQICDTGHEGTGYEAAIDDMPPVPTCTSTAAWVSNGTRLLATFNLDSRLVGKVTVWVSFMQSAASNGGTAQLVTITSPSGTGNEGITAGRNFVPCGQEGNTWVALPTNTASPAAAWEVTSDNLGVLESLTFAWTITYNEGALPSLPAGSSYSPLTISGQLAPTSTIAVPSAIAVSVVRFYPNPTTGTVPITIDHCVTNILFPYVVNVPGAGGYISGLAISNTSLDSAWNLTDPPSQPVATANGPAAAIPNWGVVTEPLPYNTTPQSGPCNLYLFGSATPQNMSGTGTAVEAIASVTTPSVSAGQVFADILPDIFNLPAGNFSGYVIARCQFQFGHGYAYVQTAAGAPTSYLALIIPDRNVLNGNTGVGGLFTSTPIRIAQPFSNATFDEQGEILAP